MPWSDEGKRVLDPMDADGMRMIGAAVRQRRERRGLSQRDLGVLSGIHQSTISRFERGERCGLRWRRFARMVHILGGLDFETQLPWDAPEIRRSLGDMGLSPNPRAATEQLAELRHRVESVLDAVKARQVELEALHPADPLAAFEAST